MLPFAWITSATWTLSLLAPQADLAPASDTTTSVVEAPAAPKRRRRLRPLGIAGVIVGAEGLAALAVSWVLFAGTARQIDPADHERYRFISYDREGWIFFSVGTSALSLGALAFTIDILRPYPAPQRRLSLAPALGRSQAGLALRGRF